MRRAALAVIGTVAALVLLLSFKTHSPSSLATPPAAVAGTGSGSTASAGSASGNAGSSGGSTTSTKTGSSTRSSTSASKQKTTVTGDAAETRYGPVQVRITVSGGKLADVAAIEYPTQDPRDAQINAYAIPALNKEAIAAGSAQIDMISGATFTSEGYLTSLQSALDKAGL